VRTALSSRKDSGRVTGLAEEVSLVWLWSLTWSEFKGVRAQDAGTSLAWVL
jgi:hypothetical protein